MKRINEKPGHVSFGQAFKDYWRGYVEFLGQSTRAGYWWMTLLTLVLKLFLVRFLISAVYISGIFDFYGDGNESFRPLFIALILFVVFSLVVYLPNLALRIRRWRDAGFRGRGFLVLWVIDLVIQGVANFFNFSFIYSQFANYGSYTEWVLETCRTSWATLATFAFSVLLIVPTLFPTDAALVSPTSNGFVKFFFRTRAAISDPGQIIEEE